MNISRTFFTLTGKKSQIQTQTQKVQIAKAIWSTMNKAEGIMRLQKANSMELALKGYRDKQNRELRNKSTRLCSTNFQQTCQEHTRGKGSLFSKSCRKTGYPHGEE
jgi:hypothetical protein